MLARFIESPLPLKGHHGDGLELDFGENLSGRLGSTGAVEEQLPDKAYELAHSLSLLRLGSANRLLGRARRSVGRARRARAELTRDKTMPCRMS